jgi:hypothetical protein
MIYLIVFFFIVIIIGTGLIWATVQFMGQRAGKFLNETHHAIEHITDTRSVPPQWLQSFAVKAKQARHQDNMDSLAQKTRKACLKKFDKLFTYIGRSSLVENEETRAILLSKFAAIRKQWQEMDWRSLLE